MKAIYTLSLFLCALHVCSALNNGLALTPQMGWNSWNHFACNINETLIRQTADALVSTGLAAAGYNYVNMDDCWAQSRNSSGYIQPSPTDFPSGIKALADYVHSKGLKFGLYSDAGLKTCAGRPGSLGYEKQDAASYAEWTVDYLKYDNCNNNNTSPKERYPVMRDALNATGRKIFYSMCEWGVDDPATWAPPVGNSWRTSQDIKDVWPSMLHNLDKLIPITKYAAPGGWNDPDMLEVGNGGMTDTEYLAHFSLWCATKAPLLIGCDITQMTTSTKAILTAPELIAINQDSLGKSVAMVRQSLGVLGELQIWAGPLSKGRAVAVLFNRSSLKSKMQVTWTELGFSLSANCTVRDAFAQKDLGHFTGLFSSDIESHASLTVVVTPVSSVHALDTKDDAGLKKKIISK